MSSCSSSAPKKSRDVQQRRESPVYMLKGIFYVTSLTILHVNCMQHNELH